MCGMVKPSFIPAADIRELRDLVRYRFKPTCMITGEKTMRRIASLYPTLNWMMSFLMYLVNLPVLLQNRFCNTPEKYLMQHLLFTAAVKLPLQKYRLLLTGLSLKNKLRNSDNALIISMNYKGTFQKQNRKSFVSVINMMGRMLSSK